MSTFTLHLQGAAQYERVENIQSFIGEDDSGSFGIMANHQRMMADLVFGIARFRLEDAPWQYLALPRALIYFTDNELFVNTRRYIRHDRFEAITALLEEQLAEEERALGDIRQSMRQMEDEMLKRLWQVTRGARPAQ